MFQRSPSASWHSCVPGARWFRADLHLHTLDDHPCSSFRWPAGVSGSPTDPETQQAYARAFLRAAIARGIEVLGLTPHAVRSDHSDETSATWRIVDTWNTGLDDDGVAFRDKIYAVFPGFEPSLNDGREGVHLLFLFDPEIGRDRFLRAFATVMGGITPYDGPNLRNTSLVADQVFERLDELHRREGDGWSFLCLAPHAFTGKGMFNGMKGQILQTFPNERLSGLELGDYKTPEQELSGKEREWLRTGMPQCRHAFFHASDAYAVSEGASLRRDRELGFRFTLVKLARPRIEALRQAFLASESRLRIAFEPDPDLAGGLRVRVDLPDPEAADRPWLRSVTIRGGGSFFGGSTGTGEQRTQTFHFSPDFTCVIGGSMTGKSTLLDGLRTHFDLRLPRRNEIRAAVTGRATDGFSRGSPDIRLDIGGPTNPAASPAERWPALFFSQRELKDAAEDQNAIRQILFHLDPERSARLLEQEERLEQLDGQLQSLLGDLGTRRQRLAETEQSFKQVEASKHRLEAYQAAGVEAFQRAQGDVGQLTNTASSIIEVRSQLEQVLRQTEKLMSPALSSLELSGLLEPDEGREGFQSLKVRMVEQLSQAAAALDRMGTLVNGAFDAGRARVDRLRTELERNLISAGGSAEELHQFAALSRTASLYESYRAALADAESQHRAQVERFEYLEAERRQVMQAHRLDMGAVLETIRRRFADRIRVRVLKEGIREPLDAWIRSWREGGLTAWWNRGQVDAHGEPIGAVALHEAFCTDALEQLGMSPRVAASFKASMSEGRQLELRALRTPDHYSIELKVGEGPEDYRELGLLSGGQQVSLLLTLLLEMDDRRPLVIDQPEDELDNAYLYSTILPALRRLKGKRQVIFATHNANIVVNGDADQVIYLEATKDAGTIRAQGAIEDASIRQAILNTLDGGDTAFKLRRMKYGF